jgi:hypothetical protein
MAVGAIAAGVYYGFRCGWGEITDAFPKGK